jgi:hypothetical protein
MRQAIIDRCLVVAWLAFTYMLALIIARALV